MSDFKNVRVYLNTKEWNHYLDMLNHFVEEGIYTNKVVNTCLCISTEPWDMSVNRYKETEVEKKVGFIFKKNKTVIERVYVKTETVRVYVNEMIDGETLYTVEPILEIED